MSFMVNPFVLFPAAGGGGGFTPENLFSGGEYGGWYDISNLSTLWQDTAGTIAVILDGDPIARIDDLSGNGLNLLQATTTARPTYHTDGTAHWMSFDGGDYLYFNSLALYMCIGSGTLSAAIKTRSGTSSDEPVLVEHQADSPARRVVLAAPTISAVDGGQHFSVGSINTNRASDYDSTLPQATKYSIMYAIEPTLAKLYRNGVQQADVTTQISGESYTNPTNLVIGYNPVRSRYFNGSAYQLLFIDRTLTLGEIADLDSFYQSKMTP